MDVFVPPLGYEPGKLKIIYLFMIFILNQAPGEEADHSQCSITSPHTQFLGNILHHLLYFFLPSSLNNDLEIQDITFSWISSCLLNSSFSYSVAKLSF